MGNKTSQNQNMTSLASEVDDIALNYILTQNTIDLLRLTDKEYYDNLIILTSSVIEKRFNGLELGFLQQRIFGKNTEAIDIIPASNKMKDKVVFDISKFYIKIIMIYSAIATTIDPQYSYEKDGVKKTFYLKEMQEYKNIPKNATPMLVNLTNPMNLCRKRLSILKNKLDPYYDENQVKLNPGEQLCSISATTSLTDEVGIKELDLLYFDIFDYDTKTWSKRSAKMKQKYNKDLTLFYQIFTGKVDMPDTITSFNDIELLDLSTIDNCARDSFKKDLFVSNRNELVLLYQEKIKLIEKGTEIYRGKLVNLLRELFVVEIKDNNNKRILNPKLTMEHLLIIESDTRDNILNLYTSCEKYFIQALIIFEKIYDEQVKNLNEGRVDFIDQQMSQPEITPDFHTESYLSNKPATPTLTVIDSTSNYDKTATFPGLREENEPKINPAIAPMLVAPIAIGAPAAPELTPPATPAFTPNATPIAPTFATPELTPLATPAFATPELTFPATPAFSPNATPAIPTFTPNATPAIPTFTPNATPATPTFTPNATPATPTFTPNATPVMPAFTPNATPATSAFTPNATLSTPTFTPNATLSTPTFATPELIPPATPAFSPNSMSVPPAQNITTGFDSPEPTYPATPEFGSPTQNLNPVPPAQNATPAFGALLETPRQNTTPAPPAQNTTPVPPAQNTTPVPPAQNTTPETPEQNTTPVPPAQNTTPETPVPENVKETPANVGVTQPDTEKNPSILSMIFGTNTKDKTPDAVPPPNKLILKKNAS